MARRAKPKVVKFPRPKIEDDTDLVRTLVRVLGQARDGKVKGYALAYVVEDDIGGAVVTAATVLDSEDRLQVLGAMRRMEHNFIRNEWPEDSE